MNVLRILSFSFYLLFSFTLIAQNLVPNPSFEDLDQPMPCDYVSSSQQFNNMIQHWTAPTEGSPDLHSKTNPTNCWSHCTAANTYTGPTCFRGPQDPHANHIMCGIQLYKPTVNCSPWMEYIQVELTDPMIPGNDYYASMWVSLSDYSPKAVDKLGMYFTTNAISQPSGCPNFVATPQVAATGVLTDVISWVKIEGTFTATAPFQYLTIGNFDVANVTVVITGGSCVGQGAYYYIDDITVIDALQLGVEEEQRVEIQLASELVHDELIISTSANNNGSEYLILDISGRVIDRFQLYDRQIRNVSHFSKGLYFIAPADQQVKALKFTKM